MRLERNSSALRIKTKQGLVKKGSLERKDKKSSLKRKDKKSSLKQKPKESSLKHKASRKQLVRPKDSNAEAKDNAQHALRRTLLSSVSARITLHKV